MRNLESFWNKTYKGFLSLLVKSNQLSKIDWIWLSVHTFICDSFSDVFNCAILPMTSHRIITNHFVAIKTLIGSNLKKWKPNIELELGLVNLDMWLLRGKVIVPTTETTQGFETKLEKLERTNFFSLMIIKRSITDTSTGSVPNLLLLKSFHNHSVGIEGI